jgi:hypothetical protein
MKPVWSSMRTSQFNRAMTRTTTLPTAWIHPARWVRARSMETQSIKPTAAARTPVTKPAARSHKEAVAPSSSPTMAKAASVTAAPSRCNRERNQHRMDRMVEEGDLAPDPGARRHYSWVSILLCIHGVRSPNVDCIHHTDIGTVSRGSARYRKCKWIRRTMCAGTRSQHERGAP